MGLLMRNGVAYAGSNSIELTQAEYNALVSAGTVQPDTFYCIVDADNVLPASDVTYDNSNSGLSANRVQSAIDEIALVKSNIGNIDNVTLTTSDNNKLLGVTVSGSSISVSAVTPETGTITPATGATIRGTPLIKKINGVVYIQFNINVTNTFSSRTAIGNISAGFRPAGTYAFTVGASTGINDFVNRVTTMLIAADGSIFVGDCCVPQGNIKEVVACISYPV